MSLFHPMRMRCSLMAWMLCLVVCTILAALSFAIARREPFKPLPRHPQVLPSYDDDLQTFRWDSKIIDPDRVLSSAAAAPAEHRIYYMLFFMHSLSHHMVRTYEELVTVGNHADQRVRVTRVKNARSRTVSLAYGPSHSLPLFRSVVSVGSSPDMITEFKLAAHDGLRVTRVSTGSQSEAQIYAHNTQNPAINAIWTSVVVGTSSANVKKIYYRVAWDVSALGCVVTSYPNVQKMYDLSVQTVNARENTVRITIAKKREYHYCRAGWRNLMRVYLLPPCKQFLQIEDIGSRCTVSHTTLVEEPVAEPAEEGQAEEEQMEHTSEGCSHRDLWRSGTTYDEWISGSILYKQGLHTLLMIDFPPLVDTDGNGYNNYNFDLYSMLKKDNNSLTQLIRRVSQMVLTLSDFGDACFTKFNPNSRLQDKATFLRDVSFLMQLDYIFRTISSLYYIVAIDSAVPPTEDSDSQGDSNVLRTRKRLPTYYTNKFSADSMEKTVFRDKFPGEHTAFAMYNRATFTFVRRSRGVYAHRHIHDISSVGSVRDRAQRKTGEKISPFYNHRDHMLFRRFHAPLMNFIQGKIDHKKFDSLVNPDPQ